MECIRKDKPCPFRKWVCDENGRCWWNCQWSCKYNDPFSECEVAQETWGCMFLCIYDAIDKKSVCPFKEELRRELEEKLGKMP